MNRELNMLELAQLLTQVLATFDALSKESETAEDFLEAAQAYLRESAASLQPDIRQLYVTHTAPLVALYQERLLKLDSRQAAAQVVEALQQVRLRLEQVVVESMALHDGPYLDAVVAMYGAVLEGLHELSVLDADAVSAARQNMATAAAGLTLDKQLEDIQTPLLQCLDWLKAGVDLPKNWLAERCQQWSIEGVKA